MKRTSKENSGDVFFSIFPALNLDMSIDVLSIPGYVGLRGFSKIGIPLNHPNRMFHYKPSILFDMFFSSCTPRAAGNSETRAFAPDVALHSTNVNAAGCGGGSRLRDTCVSLNHSLPTVHTFSLM